MTATTATRRSSPARFLSDLRIGTKILALAGLGVILTILVGVTGQATVDSTQNTSDVVGNRTAPRAVAALVARADWGGYRRSVALVDLAYTASGNTDAIKAVDEEYASVQADLEALRKYDLAAAEEAILTNQVLPNMAAAQQVWESQLKPLAGTFPRTAVQGRSFGKLYDTAFASEAGKVTDGLAGIADHASATITSAVKKSHDSSHSAMIRIWLLTGIGAVLLFGFGYLIARLVSGPIERLRDALVALAGGDLTVSVEVDTADEIGQMAQALNQARYSLHEAMSQINGTSTTLAGSAAGLSTISAKIAASADGASSQASGLAGTATEVSGNVQTVAAGTEQMTASIREIASSSAEAVRVAASAVSEAANATATVAKLGDSSVEIGNVVKAITTIAEQTNLLALNATIEAARAGEAGKGFAVVAEEVKQLAQETARATEDISKRVETIQVDTQEAVEAIARISQTIEDVNSYQTTIASAVEEQTATTSEISRSITEAAAGSASIADSVESVATASQASTQGIAEAERSAGELAGLSTELRQLVSRFRL
jgi:methyl-accepting chemotaxis protein